MKATNSQMSRIKRKKQFPDKVLRFRNIEKSMLFVFAQRGLFHNESLGNLSMLIYDRTGIKTKTILTDHVERGMEFVGIEVAK